MKENCFKGCFCSKEVKVKSCFPRPWKEKVGGARERGKAYGGFTLIELLVVVLIIGILTAVAVPRYKMTVDKNKITGMIPLLRRIADANEIFYLENGFYDTTGTQINIDIPCTPAGSNASVGQTYYRCGTDFWFTFRNQQWVEFLYCPKANSSLSSCQMKGRATLSRIYKHPKPWTSGAGTYGCWWRGRPNEGGCKLLNLK